MPFRALIKTHHMTSRRKIRTLSSAAKTHACTVVLKTGRPPGIMIAESDTLDELQGWVDVVKHLPFGSLPWPLRTSSPEPSTTGAELTAPPQSLRYKYYDLLYIGHSENGRLAPEQGHVKELEELKSLRKYLEACGMLGWWTENMKFM